MPYSVLCNNFYETDFMILYRYIFSDMFVFFYTSKLVNPICFLSEELEFFLNELLLSQ